MAVEEFSHGNHPRQNISEEMILQLSTISGAGRTGLVENAGPLVLKSDESSSVRDGLRKRCGSCTSKDKLMMAAVLAAHGSCIASLSIISPLYPNLAQERGMSTRTCGLVFSTFAIAGFVAAPLSGFIPPRLGVRLPVVISLIISGMSSIAFGLVEDIQDPFWFAFASFTLRVLLGATDSIYVTSIFALVTTMFRSQMGLMLSSVEMMFGVGISLGPVLGSVLFSIGGYKLPFIVMGVTHLGITMPLFKLLPDRNEYLKLAARHVDEDTSSTKSAKDASVWPLLTSWECVLLLMTITIQTAAFVYFHPVLQPFLEDQFGMKEETAGFVFLALLGSYCLSSLAAGALSDAKPHFMFHQMIAGLILAALGSFIIDSSSVLPSGFLPTSLVTTTVGLALAGTGLAFGIIPTFQGVLTAAINAGFPPNVKTYGMTSALWNTAWALGEALGPATSSTVIDMLGNYSHCFLVVSVGLMALTGVLLVHLLVVSYKPESPKATQQKEKDAFSSAEPAKIVLSIHEKAESQI